MPGSRLNISSRLACILLLAGLSAASPAQAQPTCQGLLHRVSTLLGLNRTRPAVVAERPPPEDQLSQQASVQFTLADLDFEPIHEAKLSGSEWDEVKRLLPSAWIQSIEKNNELLEEVKSRLGDARDPYTTAGALNPLSPKGEFSRLAVRKIVAFTWLTHGLALGTIVDEGIGMRVLRWVQSSAEALYVYQNLEAFGPKAETVYQTLLARSKFFADAYPVRGPPRTLQTFSYEKEVPMTNPLVSLMWRPHTESEASWNQSSDAQRVSLLKRAVLSSTATIPTALAPWHYGRLSMDGMQVYEFKHPTYEFSLSELKGQVLAIARDMRESHSFHIHQAFDIENSGPDLEKFKVWYKLRTDLLTIRGMEYGLHPGKYVGIAAEPQTIDLNSYTGKFATIGLRGGRLYGKSKGGDNFEKIGLEYRDALRDLPELFRFIATNAEHIAKHLWADPRFPNLEVASTSHAFYLRDSRAIEGELNLGEFAKRTSTLRAYYEHVPLLLLPLTDFSKYTFFDVSTLTWHYPTPEQLGRLAQARMIYNEGIRGILREIKSNPALANEPEDVTGALQYVLSDWAKAARLSELY